jgi:hypothetical protein
MIEVDANLSVDIGKIHFTIVSEDDAIVLSASLPAMLALYRERRLLSAFRTVISEMVSRGVMMAQSIQWRWGPVRLTVLRPSGPTFFGRLLHL